MRKLRFCIFLQAMLAASIMPVDLCAGNTGAPSTFNGEFAFTGRLQVITPAPPSFPIVSLEDGRISFSGHLFLCDLNTEKSATLHCHAIESDLVFEITDSSGKRFQFSFVTAPSYTGNIEVTSWNSRFETGAAINEREYTMKGGEGAPKVYVKQTERLSLETVDGREYLVLDETTSATRKTFFGQKNWLKRERAFFESGWTR